MTTTGTPGRRAEQNQDRTEPVRQKRKSDKTETNLQGHPEDESSTSPRGIFGPTPPLPSPLKSQRTDFYSTAKGASKEADEGGPATDLWEARP